LTPAPNAAAIGRAAGDLPAPPTPPTATTAIFADLDGTLAEIEPTPGEVVPDATRQRLLARLSGVLGGRLAVISGRGLDDLDRVLEGRVAAVGAVHGLVRRTAAGALLGPGRDPRVARAVTAFDGLAAREPGLLVEDKGAAVSLHYRLAPATAGECGTLARRLAAEQGLLVQPGDMVVEVRAPGPDKGDAVAAFMREAPFIGATPIFIGDDVTDEDGFRAAETLGGYGVVVGPRRPTRARYALPDVRSVQAWLGSMLETAT
jgi:trehalose 6-phosphate phosphatase